MTKSTLNKETSRILDLLEQSISLMSYDELDRLDMILWSEFKEREFEAVMNDEAKKNKKD